MKLSSRFVRAPVQTLIREQKQLSYNPLEAAQPFAAAFKTSYAAAEVNEGIVCERNNRIRVRFKWRTTSEDKVVAHSVRDPHIADSQRSNAPIHLAGP
jgi:uncharacterized protein involved in type VI secretion and phage assembly